MAAARKSVLPLMAARLPAWTLSMATATPTPLPACDPAAPVAEPSAFADDVVDDDAVTLRLPVAWIGPVEAISACVWRGSTVVRAKAPAKVMAPSLVEAPFAASALLVLASLAVAPPAVEVAVLLTVL